MQNKLYVVTRTDLSKAQQAVQAGHALAEYLLHNDTTWDNGTLVYLKVKNEKELISLTKLLNSDRVVFTEFREPDFGDQLTAIASLGSNDWFSWLKLL